MQVHDVILSNMSMYSLVSAYRVANVGQFVLTLSLSHTHTHTLRGSLSLSCRWQVICICVCVRVCVCAYARALGSRQASAIGCLAVACVWAGVNVSVYFAAALQPIEAIEIGVGPSPSTCAWLPGTRPSPDTLKRPALRHRAGVRL